MRRLLRAALFESSHESSSTTGLRARVLGCVLGHLLVLEVGPALVLRNLRVAARCLVLDDPGRSGTATRFSPSFPGQHKNPWPTAQPEPCDTLVLRRVLAPKSRRRFSPGSQLLELREWNSWSSSRGHCFCKPMRQAASTSSLEGVLESATPLSGATDRALSHYIRRAKPLRFATWQGRARIAGLRFRV